ncbi:hypothetical protein [Rhizobacter sp. Root1221]|uniref:hypothetical protein n=1 Tax=Rhizobacter sp. Root1221 TaxID=1736433 RepID=UPI0006FBF14B|nr:hypothetical protein [Rhizobacter sp. Root1221]KQV78747.1 hypothetical protein ASC87_10400 [Rhizobacter sp. Root1221]
MTHVESTDLDPLMQGEPPEAEALLSPQARLDASRAALQQWMIRTYHPERLAPNPDTAAHGPVRPDATTTDDPPWLSALVESLSDVPIGAVAARYLRRWWRRHPLRATAELGDELGRELLGPAVEKHPWLVLGGAVVAGALLSRLKPWRWLSGTAILSSILPPISLASLLASVTAMFQSAPAEPASAPSDETEAEVAEQVSEPA